VDYVVGIIEMSVACRNLAGKPTKKTSLCEHDNEASGSIKGRIFFFPDDRLSVYQGGL